MLIKYYLNLPRWLFQLSVILFVFASCDNNPREVNRTVYINSDNGKYTLYRNGQPYQIKGAAGHTNLKKLREIGGNTIRTYDTLNLGSILDDAEKNNLAVMVGLPIAESKYVEYVYNNSKKRAKQLDDLTKVVNRYKDHPALLMWCVGNELIFRPHIKYYNFYTAFNDIVEMIHRDDPNHPVTTTMMNLRRKDLFGMTMFTDIDVISINIFGSVKELRNNLKNLSWFWEGPFIVAEWGIEGPWLQQKNAWSAHIEGTSTKKAEQYNEMYGYIPHENPRFLGSFVFYWGQKQETTHTWFSMFNQQGQQTEAVGVMQYHWSGKRPKVLAPRVNYMLVNGKGAMDNILFKPGEIAEATLDLPETDTSDYTIWELYPEDWYKKNNNNSLKKINPISKTIISSSYLKASFKVPAKEGPYRIFATIYDRYGNFATCNTPFYVVSN